jgi:hypothetical protein
MDSLFPRGVWDCSRRLLRRQALSIDGKVGAIHAAQIATTTFLGRDDVRRMIAPGIKSRRECEHLGRTEFDAKAAGLAAFDDDGDASFDHGTPTLE